MRGFFCGDADALTAGDPVMAAGEKGTESEFFAAKNGDTRSTHSMDRLTFQSFVEYSSFVAEGARKELKAGYIGVSPAKAACLYCPYGGICGFHPEKSVQRKEELNVKPERVASIVNELIESGAKTRAVSDVSGDDAAISAFENAAENSGEREETSRGEKENGKK